MEHKMDWWFGAALVGAVPECHSEDGAEQAFDLLVHLCPNPHLWS